MEEVKKEFFNYRQGIIDMRDSMNKDYIGFRIDQEKQRRELLKYVSATSLAILGLSSFILEKSNNIDYIITALALHSVIVVFVILYFRELIDDEAMGLIKQQDGYNNLSDTTIDVVDKYIQAGDFSVEKFQMFTSELKNLKEIQDLKKENDLLKESRLKRDKNLDYTGEFLVSLFIIATLLILLGVTGIKVSFIDLIISIGLVFYASFSNLISKLVRLISKNVEYIKKII